MKTALLIPIYQPKDNVLPFLSAFHKTDFDLFLVVDDGSGEEYQDRFASIANQTPFQVYSYPLNRGKGHALKAGIRRLKELEPNLDFIVTADGDGQHLKKDILRLKKEANSHEGALLLGTRDFALPNVPKKSRLGNRFSSTYFRLLTGKKVQDTQTGLRAIPKALFPLALETEGNRYEYENNFLLDAAKQSPIVEVPIETVYEDNNAGSHFRPLKDSLLIFKKPLLYILVSLGSFLLDLGFFSLFVYVLFLPYSEFHTALSTVLARILSGAFNFFLLRYLVFKGKQKTWASALKYLALFLINMGLSAALTSLFTYLGSYLAFLKVLIDMGIAIANYFINRIYVFSNAKRKRAK